MNFWRRLFKPKPYVLWCADGFYRAWSSRWAYCFNHEPILHARQWSVMRQALDNLDRQQNDPERQGTLPLQTQ